MPALVLPAGAGRRREAITLRMRSLACLRQHARGSSLSSCLFAAMTLLSPASLTLDSWRVTGRSTGRREGHQDSGETVDRDAGSRRETQAPEPTWSCKTCQRETSQTVQSIRQRTGTTSLSPWVSVSKPACFSFCVSDPPPALPATDRSCTCCLHSRRFLDRIN